MKFVALISGGKDSFFNIMHCMHNGHTLSALANLHPSDASVNELDSFMFQTVGHDVIESYRQCMPDGIPLYRRAISGKSANVELEYEPTPHDEIEDLLELLQEVKQNHPDIEGVSCGAILSHYQRTRVENVCGRLGLTCLSYLWQRDQPELMGEMCKSGLDAILVKVAAIGLTEKHLGRSISDMFPILMKLNAMYDVHVCGEGGEFETLVLDAPFFVKKLKVVDSKIVSHSQDASYLSIKVEVVDKNKADGHESLESPPLLTDEFNSVSQVDAIPEGSIPPSPSQASFSVKPHIVTFDTRLAISNLTSTLETVEDQTTEIFEQLAQHLASHKRSFAHIQHMTVLVKDMAHFARMNAVYESYFAGLYLPPSRVCVETALASPNLVQISCLVAKPDSSKSGIHIRSRSYWAPQNIGPYSQAIVENQPNLKVATLSGQIPLVPSDMSISDAFFEEQAALSLQHLYRVKSLVGVRQLANCVCFITDAATVPAVAEVWKYYVDEVEHGQDFLHRLLIVQMSTLPRQASVEWGGLSYEKVVSMYEDDDDTEVVPSSLADFVGKYNGTTVSLGENAVSVFTGTDTNELVDILKNPIVANTQICVYTDLDTVHRLSNMGLSAEWCPTYGVWDSAGAKKSYGIIWRN